MRSVNNIAGLSIALMLVACSDNQKPSQNRHVGVNGAADAEFVKPDSPLGKLSSASDITADTTTVDSDYVSSDSEEFSEPRFQDQYLENDEDSQQLYSYDEPSNKVEFSTDDAQGVIRWKAPDNVDFEATKVVISSTNGDTTTRDFKAGEAIELFGDLPDGVYSWETVVKPRISESTREEMRAIRQLGNRQAQEQRIQQLRENGQLPTQEQADENRQSGSFIVLGGIVNPPPTSEIESASREDG